MGGLTYSGKFEKSLNHSYSHANVKDTAKKFADYEKAHGHYEFGKSFTKTLIPKPDDWADAAGSTEGHANWEKHVSGISPDIRKKVTDLISSNLKSPAPLPMVFKIGENVDETHDLRVKTFAHKGHIHIGVHVLCPNTKI